MWEFFIRNSRFSYLFIVALLGFGVFSVLAIPKESAPEVQVPVGIVTTILPGAPAADVENLVTNELERGLAGALDNVKQITSVSREGVSSITVEFEASADIDTSINDLKDRIETLKTDLPTDAEDPVVTEVDFVDQPILTVAIAGDLTDAEFTALGDELERVLERVAGVSRVEVSGVRDHEVTVVLDQASLVRFGLSAPQVVSAIRTANATLPIGQIVTDGVRYNIAFEGDVATPEAVANIPITTRGSQPVYVRDVGSVQIGLAPVTRIARLSVAGAPSESAITFDVYKRRGGDITALTTDLNDAIENLQKTDGLLADLTVYTVLDAGNEIKKDLIQLSTSGLQTVILVVLLLVIAIGWREGLLAGVSIPLSFTIGFIGLYLSGNTINFISLFALILGIGVLVDSGIVMVEGINRRMKDEPTIDKVQVAILTIREFNLPLVSGTLTTVSMFAGLFIVSGVTGQFIAGIPFTLIFILFASLLVALGFIPLLAAGFLRRRSTTKMEQLQVAYSHQFEEWYRRKLSVLLRSRSRKWLFAGLLMVGFVSAIALVPAGLVKVVFFEQSDAEAIFVEVELPEGTIKETTDIAVRRVEDILYQYPEYIEAFSVTIGAGSAFGAGGSNEKLANVYIALTDERDKTSTEITELLRTEFSQFNDILVTISQPSNGPPTGSPVGVKLLGDDLTALSDAATIIARELGSIPGTANIRTSTNNNSTEIVLTLDKAKTAAVGLDPQVVSQTLRSAVFGADATSLTSLTDDTDVVVRLNLTTDDYVDPAEANYTTLDTLKNIQLATPRGDLILLDSLVMSSLRESSTAINHEDQERIVSVSADTTATGNVREINAELTSRLETLTLPAGVTVSLGGENEDSDQAFGELFLALIVGIILMLAVLVLQFDSFRHTFYVLSILPFSLIGILYGLMVTGSALSFPSIMGFIALSGIVVNNSILLIDQMNQLRRRNPSLGIQSVVIEAAVSRLRPILLTSLTTIAGMIPLLYTDDLWIPLATAVMFGLAFSVVITLILIPVIYSKYPGEVRS